MRKSGHYQPTAPEEIPNRQHESWTRTYLTLTAIPINDLDAGRSLLGEEVEKIAGATDGRARTRRKRKIQQSAAGFKCVIKSGSDGVRYRTCYVWTASNIDYRIVVQYWLEQKRAAQFSSAKPHELGTPYNVRALLPAQIEKVA